MNSNTVSPLMSLASSLESLKVPNASAESPAGLSQKGNFLNQLESMMNAVKKEAGALENMKLKIKEMEELKIRHNELKGKLVEIENENSNLHRLNRESELTNQELRSDMQRLNDIFNADRIKQMELAQQKLLVEQELSSAHGQIEYLTKESQKIPELQKTNKGLKKQVHQLKQAVEDEKASYALRIQDLERTMKEVEKSREEASSHFWNLTEEINSTKRALDAAQQNAADLNTQLEESKKVFKQQKDRTLMVAEDLQHTRQRNKESSKSHKGELQALQLELTSARSALKQKDTELENLHANHTQLQEYQVTLKSDMASLTNNSSKLQATIADLTAKNKEIISENQNIKQKLNSKGVDLNKYTAEVEQLKALLTQTENSFAQKETDYLHSIKQLSNTKEELSFKVQTTTSQLEAVSAQSKSEQTKHWEEVERLKNIENQLLEECEKLTTELTEKTVKLHALETEKVTAETNMRLEASGANTMVNALRDELERRLEDLVGIRKERDTLHEERTALSKQLEEVRAEAARNDSNLKKVLESDRNKMKQEMLTRSNRIKALETEKQEMLNEMNDLMKQVSESQRAATQAANDLEDSKLRGDKLNEQLDWIKTKNNDLLAELKSMAKVEQDLRDKAFAAESKHKEEIRKLNDLVGETKKSSGMHVIEMTNQMKGHLDEIDELKRQLINHSDSEKQAYIEVERLKSQLDNFNKARDSSESQLKNENDNMRRELQEVRTKGKITLESKAKVEMEVISLRNELTRTENELAHQVDINRELNKNCNELLDKSKQSASAVEAANESVKQLKAKVLELEDIITKKNGALDRLSNDCEQLERDGFQAEKRLRMQLNSAESEINELKPIIPMLQKELADVKTNFSKLQTSTSVEINNLMEELRCAEERTAAERKKAAAASEEAQKKIQTLQAQSDKRREQLDEMQNRSKTEKGDRELLVMQLESEIERLKTLAGDKDTLIGELEKQKHADRLKVHELNKKCDTAERDLIDCKTTLEIEQQRSQRLEAKLRLTLTTGEHAAVVRGEFMNSPLPEGMGVGAGAGGGGSYRNAFSRGGGDRQSSGSRGGLGGGGGEMMTMMLSEPSGRDREGRERDRERDREGARGAYSSLSRQDSRDRGDNNHSSNNSRSERSDREREQSRSIKFSEPFDGVGGGGGNNDDVMSHSSTVYRSSSNNESSSRHATLSQSSSGEEYRPITPTRKSLHGAGQQEHTLRGSQSVPHLYNDGHLVSGSDYLMRSPDGRSGGSNNYTHQQSPFHSPRANAAAVQSPVLERVSQTLAARTTAESSKAALRQAQQIRNNQNNFSSNSSVGPNSQQQQAFQYQAQPSSNSYQSLRKAPAAAAVASANHDPYYDDIQPNLVSQQQQYGGSNGHWQDAPIAPMNHHSSSSYSSNSSTAAAGGGGSSGSGSGGRTLTAAEECIERTKRLLDKKNGLNNASGGNIGSYARPPPISNTNADFEVVDAGGAGGGGGGEGGPNKTPNSGRSASKLNEAVQVAHSMYPNEANSYDEYVSAKGPQHQQQRSALVTPYDIRTPQLKPASPPRAGLGSTVRSSAELGLDLENLDDDDNEAADEEYEGGGGGPLYAAAGGAAGGGVGGTGGNKKAKKKKAGKKTAGAAAAAAGGDEGLMFPKLANKRKP